MRSYPGLNRLPLEKFRKKNEMIVFFLEGKDASDVDVIDRGESLCLLFKLLPYGRIDARDRDQAERSRFSGTDINGFVCDRVADSTQFAKRPVFFSANAIVLEIGFRFHKSSADGNNRTTASQINRLDCARSESFNRTAPAKVAR